MILEFGVLRVPDPRLKHWSRVRYSRLQLSELDLHEYTFYVNVGSSVDTVFKALAD